MRFTGSTFRLELCGTCSQGVQREVRQAGVCGTGWSRWQPPDAATPRPAPHLRGSKDWMQRRPVGHEERINGRAVSTRRESAARSERPAVILSSPAVRASPLALGHPDTHRARPGSRSRLGAIAVRHTGGRDAAWHGPQGSGGALAPMCHPWTWGTRTSSGDVRGVGASPLHATLPGALAAQRCWRMPA